MEVRREFMGDKAKAFDIIMEALVNDVNKDGKQVLEAQSIQQGYVYYKNLVNRFGKEGKVQVTIKELEAPNYYEAHFESKQGTNKLSYRLVDKDNESFDLIYKEEFHSEKTSYSLNFKLMSYLFKKSSKKRVQLMLNNLQILLNQ